MAMTLIQAMRTDHPAVAVSGSLSDAAQELEAAECMMLPVMDGTDLVGTVTAQDLVSHGIRAGFDLRDITLREAMNPQPLTCAPEAGLEEVAALLRDRRQPAVLVVETGGRLLGMIDIFSVLSALDRGTAAGPEPDEVKRVRGEGG